jgi:FlaA1/EpsC-like NDP-sugar epimerase
LDHAHGGKIFVPRIPSYRVTDIASAIDCSCEQKLAGIRPGEKLNEEMITAAHAPSTIDLGVYFSLLAPACEISRERYCGLTGATKVRKILFITVVLILLF